MSDRTPSDKLPEHIQAGFEEIFSSLDEIKQALAILSDPTAQLSPSEPARRDANH